MDEKKIMKRNLWMFPLGTIGRDMMYCLVTNFLLTYILFTKGLDKAQLGAITAIMVGARVFDGLNDPIMGNIIENTHTRWGKFKPWMVIGIILSSIVVTMVFGTDLKGWGFVALFAVFYFSYSIAFTMHDISFWGIVPALSSDAGARDQFTSRATLFAGVGGTLASMLIPMLTTGESAIGGNANTAYKVVAIGICILAPAFFCITIFGVKEHREEKKQKKSEGFFKKLVNAIKYNDQLRWIAVIFLIQQIANNIILGGIGSTYIYLEFGYEGGLYSIFSTVGVAATAFLMIFYPVISRKINRKPLMNLMAVISVIGFAMMILSRFVPASIAFALITIGYMTSNFGLYAYYLIMMISIINTVEYSEYKTGNRDEAIIASLRPFVTKMSSALTVIITYVSYMLFNVTSYTDKISEYENAAAAGTISSEEKLTQITEVISGVDPAQTWGLLIFMTIIPCALMLLSNVLYQKKYTLDEAEYNRICSELEVRKYE